MYVYPRLIHVDVWQKRKQYCRAIALQLKTNKLKKKKKKKNPPANAGDTGFIPGLGGSHRLQSN